MPDDVGAAGALQMDVVAHDDHPARAHPRAFIALGVADEYAQTAAWHRPYDESEMLDVDKRVDLAAPDAFVCLLKPHRCGEPIACRGGGGLHPLALDAACRCAYVQLAAIREVQGRDVGVGWRVCALGAYLCAPTARTAGEHDLAPIDNGTEGLLAAPRSGQIERRRRSRADGPGHERSAEQREAGEADQLRAHRFIP